MEKKTTALIYWDRSASPEGWAYRYTRPDGQEESGPLSDEDEGASMEVVLCEFPVPVPAADAWRPLEGDGPGWEVRS